MPGIWRISWSWTNAPGGARKHALLESEGKQRSGTPCFAWGDRRWRTPGRGRYLEVPVAESSAVGDQGKTAIPGHAGVRMGIVAMLLFTGLAGCQTHPSEPVQGPPATPDAHGHAWDLGAVHAGQVGQASNGTARAGPRTRMIVSFNGTTGAALLPIDWSNATDSTYTTYFSVVGAFLANGKVMTAAPDSWFLSRYMFRGKHALDYEFDHQQFDGGAFNIALNEPVWSATTLPGGGVGTTSYDGLDHDSRETVLVVAWKMPAGATDLAIAVCWRECPIGKEVPPSNVFGDLATDTDSVSLLRPLQETSAASMSYWSSHDYGEPSAGSRMPKGIFGMNVTIGSDYNVTGTLFVNRQVQAWSELPAIHGFSEMYAWWRDPENVARWNLTLESAPQNEHTASPTTTLENGYGLELGVLDDNATFQRLSISIENQVGSHRPDTPTQGVGETPEAHVYLVQTGLSLSKATALELHSRYIALPPS